MYYGFVNYVNDCFIYVNVDERKVYGFVNNWVVNLCMKLWMVFIVFIGEFYKGCYLIDY